MSNELLVDTNILVYAIDEDSQFYATSRSVLQKKDKTLFTTSKNITEFLTVMTRSSGYGLSTETALNLLQKLIQQLEIIYPTPDSLATFLELVASYQPSGLKLHDFEIISIALANGICDIATFNQKDFQTITEITLFEL
ncbi:type II toxin-antitoxin system VapC family toxin (plasmid) [Euhalothece natronophila Z-M001]|uniref:Type II toxin-antitoxin system VapC family toxin n=1 Tax=Euhalothece natronophila Z-M001 TaxID=522448 RepID=A0A5B8NRE5_9CHRO|nr:type II toxin-antitoxin system VapC family toxin [Euhalothece natronophila]QDZ41598.1 type II toxin-antitoxin system VapC family toxin [Euhalothece natronophila Z-M001]